MVIDFLLSNEQTLAELGKRLRAARIDTPLTQRELADRAGVSLSTVATIERGGDARMGSYLCVLRALGMLSNVDALVPEHVVRPSQLLELGHERKRATSPAHRHTSLPTWTWGDEQ